MKRLLHSLAIFLAIGAAMTTTLPSYAQIQERTIRFSVGPAEDHPESDGVRDFARLVEQKSSGKIKVKGFFNGLLGSDSQAIQGLRSNTLEMTAPSSSPLVGLVKEFGVFDLPFLFNSNEEADALLDGPFGEHVLAKLQAKEMVGLGYWDNGFRNVTNSRRAITTAEGLKGLKLRVMQNPVYMDTFNALGVNAVPMAFSEVFTALETKTIDGQENPFTTIVTARLYEVQKFMSVSRHTYTPYVILISKKYWDGLSIQEQSILREAAHESRKLQRQINRKMDAAMLEKLKTLGMEVSEFSTAEQGKLRNTTKPIHEKFLKDIAPETVKLLNSELERIRAKR